MKTNNGKKLSGIHHAGEAAEILAMLAEIHITGKALGKAADREWKRLAKKLGDLENEFLAFPVRSVAVPPRWGP